MEKPPKAAADAALLDAIASLAEGDTDPILKKVVATHIVSGADYIVYLDQDHFVQYMAPDGADPPDSAAVFNRVGLLETLSLTLAGTEHLQPLRRLLGEAVARLYTYKSAAAAVPVLDEAERYLAARQAELARRWFLTAAGLSCALFCSAAAIAWAWHSYLEPESAGIIVTLVLGAAAGSLGALISIILRTASLHLEAGAGWQIHWIEAGGRILTGAIGSMFTIFAVRANIVAGFINQADNSLYTLLFLAFCAGASERFVPTLIEQGESKILAEARKRAPTPVARTTAASSEGE